MSRAEYARTELVFTCKADGFKVQAAQSGCNNIVGIGIATGLGFLMSDSTGDADVFGAAVNA